MLYTRKAFALLLRRHSIKQGKTIHGDFYYLMRKTALQQKSDLEKQEAAKTSGFQIPTQDYRQTDF